MYCVCFYLFIYLFWFSFAIFLISLLVCKWWWMFLIEKKNCYFLQFFLIFHIIQSWFIITKIGIIIQQKVRKQKKICFIKTDLLKLLMLMQEESWMTAQYTKVNAKYLKCFSHQQPLSIIWLYFLCVFTEFRQSLKNYVFFPDFNLEKVMFSRVFLKMDTFSRYILIVLHL